MSLEVTKSITAGDTFSDEITLQGYFSVSIVGIAGGTTVTVQRLTGVDGTTFTDVESFTENAERYGYEPEAVKYKIGVKSGNFGSGTAKVRLGLVGRGHGTTTPIR
jgi:hypothetical protein